MLKQRSVPAAILLAVTLLLTPPVFAAPNPDAGPALQLRQVLAGWWVELSTTFGLSTDTLDPDGQPSSTSEYSRETLDPNGAPAAQSGDDPTASPQSRELLDPDG